MSPPTPDRTAGDETTPADPPADPHRPAEAVPHSIPASQVPPPLRGPDDSGEEKKGFLGISGPQVLAGALAASTSAVAASYLGVAGTVIGAGLGSVIATVSTAVYQKSIQRSNKVLARVTTTVVGRPDDVAAMLHVGHDSTSVAPDPHLLDEMQARPPVTPAYGSASVPPPGAAPLDRPAGRVRWYSGLPWKRIAAASATVFILVMGVITAIEAIDGRTVAEAVRGEQGDGTTVGTIVGNDDDTSTSPTPQESESVTDEPTPSDTPSDELTPSDDVSQAPSGEPSDTTEPSEGGEPSDGTSEAPLPGQTLGDGVSSAPVQPMEGTVTTTSPSPSPVGFGVTE